MLAVVFGVCLLVFAYAWWISHERPGVSLIWEGYYKGVDQSAYLSEANDLADGHLPKAPQEYPYGLGYPALAVPLILLGFERDPFAVPDALMFAATVTIVVAVGTRVRSLPFGVAAGALLAFGSPMLAMMVYPWANTVTVFTVAGALAVAVLVERPTWRTGLVVGGLAALAFAARYVDVVFPLGVIGFAALRRPRAWLVAGAVAVVVLAVVGGVVGVTHERVFGSWTTTPYSLHVLPGEDADTSLSAYDLRKVPVSAWEIFVTGRDGARRVAAEPLLRVVPWAVAAPAGLLVLLLRRHRNAWAMLGAAVVSAAGSALYLSYRGTKGSALEFQTLRYFEPWFPLWALLAAYAAAAMLDRTGRRGARDGGRYAVEAAGAPDGQPARDGAAAAARAERPMEA